MCFMIKLKIIFLIFIFFLLNFFISAQETSSTRTGEIFGRVVSAMTQKPIPGITVSLVNTNLGAFTNSNGEFRIKNIPVGVYSVRFTGVGFQTYVQSDINVNAVKPIQLEIELVERIIELGDVEVRSSFFLKKAESVTSTQTFSSEDIRRAPGVQEDVIRALALLPGVGFTQAGRNDLLVRGGAPYENLFIVDNIEVPNINHFGTQGTSGGPLSLINIDFVRNVSFSAGGFGAQYGDKLSSITNITLRNGNEDKLGGKAILSATGFGVSLEGPVSENGSFILNARRSYLDLIFKAAGFGFIPQYWDFTGKLNYRLDQKNIFSFLTIGALDDVILNNDNEDKRASNSRVAVPNQKQYFSGFNWKHIFDKGFLNITLSEVLVDFNTFQNDSNLVTVFQNKSKEAETGLKTDIDLMLNDKFNIVIGNQLKWATSLDYEIIIPGFLRRDDQGIPKELKVDTTFSAIKNSTYAALTTAIGMHKVTVGGRLDYFNFTIDKLFFSPRLSVIYQINPVSAVIFSAGRFYQSPSYIWLIGDQNQKLNPLRADQLVLGYEHTPLEDVKVQLEVFYKWYGSYPGRVFRPQAVLSPSGFDDITSDIPFGLEPLINVAEGFSRGAELFIQKKYTNELPFFGLLSVTYSQTKFKSLDGVERLGAYDTPLIFNLSLGYKPSMEWEFSFKYRAAIGIPTTPFITDPNSIFYGQRDFSRYNEGDRLEIFRATDIRIDKRWMFSNFSLITYLDIQNIFSTKNPSGIRWDQRKNQPEIQRSFGILPSIGVSFEF